MTRDKPHLLKKADLALGELEEGGVMTLEDAERFTRLLTESSDNEVRILEGPTDERTRPFCRTIVGSLPFSPVVPDKSVLTKAVNRYGGISPSTPFMIHESPPQREHPTRTRNTRPRRTMTPGDIRERLDTVQQDLDKLEDRLDNDPLLGLVERLQLCSLYDDLQVEEEQLLRELQDPSEENPLVVNEDGRARRRDITLTETGEYQRRVIDEVVLVCSWAESGEWWRVLQWMDELRATGEGQRNWDRLALLDAIVHTFNLHPSDPNQSVENRTRHLYTKLRYHYHDRLQPEEDTDPSDTFSLDHENAVDLDDLLETSDPGDPPW